MKSLLRCGAIVLVLAAVACTKDSDPSTTSTTTTTAPAGPAGFAFGPGQKLLGSAIHGGRYFSDPGDSCFWRRLSGLGGTPEEVIADEFILFNPGQWVVDIRDSDRAFNGDTDCGDWFTTMRRGLESSITQGVWLVGAQITPGTYQSNVAEGCYWERNRDFEGTVDGIIANDYVSAPGPYALTISAGDAGFQSGVDCGIWTRASGASASAIGREHPQDRSAIERNRQLHRGQ